MTEKRAILLNEIERQDRRYRLALMVFMVSTVLAIGILAGFQVKTNHKIDRQLGLQGELLTQQGKLLDAIKSSGEKNTGQLQQVNDHIDCIASFFNSRDRASAVITNLDQCRIERLDGSTATLPRSDPAPTKSKTTTQSGGKTPQNSQQGGGGSTSGNTDNNDPMEVLGIPVCVPFTNACVR